MPYPRPADRSDQFVNDRTPRPSPVILGAAGDVNPPARPLADGHRHGGVG